MEKINKIKKFFRNEKIDGYIVPKNDEFFGEYIPKFNDRLKYISDFTGSYGFAVILNNYNYLFVDGRYTLQSSKQSGKFFNIKTVPKELPRTVLQKKNLKIGFDPKLFTRKTLNIFFGKSNCKFVPLANNLVDKIWIRGKNTVKNKFYALPQNSIGQNYKNKVNKLVSNLKRVGADF